MAVQCLLIYKMFNFFSKKYNLESLIFIQSNQP